ncbi:cysteine-rich VLP protein [uncultured Ruminococcus sp.]|uniref:cysteine-rich VLP protein n=1 Tax=uncultured Ruminococcus sp. TaxID=165186 RepID=UPI00292D17C6|nr:cysteine-rich VLP protein [uncultured Ruminococcus sp.]
MIVSIKPEQVKQVNALVRSSCANCRDECCLLLDDGDSHPCIQLLSVSGICCRYFLTAVLPADEKLYSEIIQNDQ